MRAKEITEGSVIDARDRFKKKSINPIDLRKDYDSYSKKFKEQEDWISQTVEHIDSIPNNLLTARDRLTLAPLLKNYKPDSNYLMVLLWTIKVGDSTEQETEIAKNYIRFNRNKILDSLKKQTTALAELETEIQNKNIPDYIVAHSDIPYMKTALTDLHNFYKKTKF